MPMEITVPQPMANLLLQQAAEREVSVEEIVTSAIKKCLERSV